MTKSPTSYIIQYGSHHIHVHRKKIKSLRLSVKDDGTINLSAGLFYSEEAIMKFLDQNKKWLDKQINRVENIQKNDSNTLENSDNIRILGDIYTITIIFDDKDEVILDEDTRTLYLFVKPDNTQEMRQKIIEDYLMKMLHDILLKFLDKYGTLTGLVPSSCKIRDMSTAWGICYSRSRKITFNYRLIKEKLSCIEYVVLHEICHLRYPNHQREFWALVETYMRDWKARRKELKNNI